MIRFACHLFGTRNVQCPPVLRKLNFRSKKFHTAEFIGDMPRSKISRRQTWNATRHAEPSGLEHQRNFGTIVKYKERETYTVAPDVIDTVEIFFPTAKQLMYQIYQQEKHNFTETLSYDGALWTCSYNVGWPYSMTVSASAQTKKEASHRATLSLLHYLMKTDAFDVNSSKNLPWVAVNSTTYLSERSSLFNRQENANRIQIRNLSTSSQRRNRSSVKANRKKVIDVEVPPAVESESVESELEPENCDVAGSKEIDEIQTLFPYPKNILHNCFDLLAQELKKNDLKLNPHYKYNSLTKAWACTYHLKWPEDVKFTKSDVRKREASHKCAIACLHWLKTQKKINSSGQPLLFQKEVIRDLKQKSSVLSLSQNVEDGLNLISDLYANKLLNHLVTNFNECTTTEDESKYEKEVFENLWPKESKRKWKQRYLGLDVYQAKEKKELPISHYKQEIIDTIDNNRIVLIKGESGCGKSIRIPQYVLEGWATNNEEEPCRIIVTQPRRIAAVSLAERVAYEREEEVGDIVGYQVRLKSNFSRQTGRILYCTTGILLRHIQSDPSLSDCTHILLDEAHERDVNTDLLMNLLKHAMKINPNLKLVIMSATIDTSLFQQYFEGVPVIYITGFSHPVKAHFIDSSRTLDFSRTLKMCEGESPTVVNEDIVSLIKFIHIKKPEGAILCFLPGWEDITKLKKNLPSSSDMMVLCLHSKLQDSEQHLVFSKPPPGVRKVILATNIAETSVTIDDVVYVIDTGIHKENRLDLEKGITCIDNHWISQSSMTQRKGRAGRVQPGESFHLYPKNKSETFEPFSIPEILRTSLTKIVLDSKVYSNNMDAIEFLSQLPSPPEVNAVKQAVEELKELELLDENENLTPLGRVLSNFQLEPKLSKVMVNAVVFKCVTPIVDIVTLFSSEQEIFSTVLTYKEDIKETKSEFSKDSDHLSLMRIFEKWLEYMENRDVQLARHFMRKNKLLDYKLGTLRKLREIHFEYLNKGLQNVLPISDEFSDNDELVKAVLLSGVSTVLQHRNWDIVKGRLRKTNVLLTRHNHKATIASASVNYKRSQFPTDFLLYINETRSNVRRTTSIRETSLISPLAVLLFKNNKLDIMDVMNAHEQLASQDQVRLTLAGTKIEFICDRKQAEAIVKCKDALQAGLQYYIFQLTKGAEYNNKINKYWNEILSVLNDMFANMTK